MPTQHNTLLAPGMHVGLIGGGGHAAVVADAITRANAIVHAIYDDEDVNLPHPPLGDDARGRTEIAGVAIKPFRSWTTVEASERPHALHIAVGNIQLRADLIEDVLETDASFISVIDPNAIISTSATIGVGAFVAAGAIVNASAEIGDHAIINTSAVVEHDCVVGENSHIAPGATLCGGAVVGRGALIGAGAIALPGSVIGPACVVGAGAVVRGELAAGSTVVGVPARSLGH